MRFLPVWAFLAAFTGTASAAETTPADQKLARDLLEELVEIDTSSTGATTPAAQAMARRLKAAGFTDADMKVLGPIPKKHNLVARLKGTGKKKPLLLLAHIDVVDARREDWTTNPYELIEKDGYYYGRGTSDDKGMAAIFTAVLIRLKKEGYRGDRDLILALTADEEGGDHNGVSWLLEHHRPLVDAEYCLNEGGGGEIKDGKYLANEVQAAEKIYQTFVLEVKNKGGHSSVPTKDNAIYRLAGGLQRLGKFDFPVMLSEITRGYFTRMGQMTPGALGRDMKLVAGKKPDAGAVKRLSANAWYNALMRTTCVATLLEAGHADNALPQTARATVNCRLLPGHDPEAVRQTLVKVLADPGIAVIVKEKVKPSPASALVPEVMKPIEEITEAMWPGIPVVPVLLTGATDGLYLRNAGIPVYGVSGIFEDIDDIRAHGQDERIGVKQYAEGYEFLYRLTKSLGGAR